MSVMRSKRSSRPKALRAPIALVALAAAGLAFRFPAASAQSLTKAEVQSILDRTAAFAKAEGLSATIVVTDREANVLGASAMPGAPVNTTLQGGGRPTQG